jgi:hypothetical protein
MSNFKNCTKCSGVVLVDRDKYGWYEQCLMCGLIRDLESIVVAGKDNQGVPYTDEKMN